MTDPDGGGATRVCHGSDAPRSKTILGRPRLSRVPPTWKGPEGSPTRLWASTVQYNYHCGGGDESMADRPRVQAGDTILVHAGV